MKKPQTDEVRQPFTSSTHESATPKPLVTRDGLNAAARQTRGAIGWIYFVFHSVAMVLFGLSIGAMFGAVVGGWLLRSGRVPAAWLLLVSRWSWAVGGALGLALTVWLVARWFDTHRKLAQKQRAQNNRDTTL